MSSIYVDNDSWDIAVDASGNIAIATGAYTLALEAACKIKTFAGELYFDTTQGIPYFSEILGQQPSIEYMRAAFTNAALSVSGVVSAKVYFSAFTDRTVSGQVQITDQTGKVAASSF